MITEIGDFLVERRGNTWVLRSRVSTFEYYLQPNELLACRVAFSKQKGLVKLRLPDLHFTHYFACMRQAVYNQLKAIAYKGTSDEELMKMIIDFEKKYAKNNGEEYLGIENQIRRESLLRNLVKEWHSTTN